MNLQDLNDVLEANRERIRAWMTEKRSEVPIPIYGSVDVRDAGWKVGVVDANHFPAGFNNVSEENLADLANSSGNIFGEHILIANGFTSIPKATRGTLVMLRTSPASNQ